MHITFWFQKLYERDYWTGGNVDGRLFKITLQKIKIWLFWTEFILTKTDCEDGKEFRIPQKMGIFSYQLSDQLLLKKVTDRRG